MDKTLDLDELERVAREALKTKSGQVIVYGIDLLTLIAAARPAVVSDEVVERMCATLDPNFRQTKAGWPEFTDYRASCIAAMRAALALLPGGEGEGSSRSLPSRTTQEPQSPTPCDLEGK